MKLVVVGATGATGRLVVERALALGNEVVAVSRRTPKDMRSSDRLTLRSGDVLAVESLVPIFTGADAVISCVGPANNLSPGTVMSVGIPNILAACRRAQVPRFVMQSGITLTDGTDLSTSDQWALRLIRLIFRQAIADKALAEEIVKTSGLDWVVVRPVGLKDLPTGNVYTAGVRARVALLRPLPFVDCADCLVRAATNESSWTGRIVNVGK
jgi:uncharacterized protein YbjT (DUF2867 family)